MSDTFITDFLKHIKKCCSETPMMKCCTCPYGNLERFEDCCFFEPPSEWDPEKIAAAYYEAIRKEQENESPKN